MIINKLVFLLPCDVFVTGRYRPIKGKQEEWKAIVEKYRIHQDIDSTIQEFMDNEWVKQHLLKKNRRQIQLFKEHVRSLIRTTTKKYY